MGTQLPSPKKGAEIPPQFSAHLYCGQTAGCIKVPLGTEVGLSLGDCVRWGPSPLPQKGRRPTQFSAHVSCGQTAAWIKMPLGTEVDLGLRDIVIDVDPAIARKRAHQPPPNFWPVSIVAKMTGWMKTPLATEVDLGPGHIVLDGSQLLRKGHSSPPPLFSAHVYCGHGRPSQLLLSSCY